MLKLVNRRNLLACLIFGLGLLSTDAKDGKRENQFHWEEIAELPAAPGMERQPGLAAPFAGAHNGAVIVAGGCNFPDVSVQEGGEKRYYDNAFVFDSASGEWRSTFRLPYGRAAYGVAATTSKGVVCIGGSNGEKGLDTSFLMSWKKEANEIEFRPLPDFPATVKAATGTADGDVVYVAGGVQDGKLSNDFYRLDLSKEGTSEFQWEKLPPYPGPARKQAVMVSQGGGAKGSIYLVSGIGILDGATVALTGGYVYDPGKKCWSAIAPTQPEGVRTPISLLGAAGIKSGTHHILFFGGFNKEVFDTAVGKFAQLEGDELATFKKAYFTQKPDDFRWNKKILAYHTVTDTWAEFEDYPYLPNCGAGIASFDDGGIVIVNGEIMPGIRTPKVYLGKLHHKAQFGTINWMVLVIYLFGMLGIGFYFMKRERGTEDFFKGGGRVPWWAAGVSIFATMLSSISFMALPGMTYSGTWAIFLLAITITLSQPIVIKYYLPFYRRLNVTSAYEYLEMRFNLVCRTLASSVFILFMIVRIGIVSYLPALALEAVTGIDIVLCIFGIGLITIVYCAMGGVEAVIWGDFIQGIVLIAGAVVAFLYIASGVDGGVGGIVNLGIDHSKFEIINTTFALDKPTIWFLLIGGLLANLFTYTSDQSVIQRYITTKDEKSATKSIWFNAIACIPVSFLFYLIGTGLYAYYQGQPELLDVSMEKSDQIFPFFIMQKLPIGLSGLLIAAVFSATMSTLSSNINSAATAITTDFYQRFNKGATDHQSMRVARISTVVVGLLGIMIAYALYLMKDLPIFEIFNMVVGLLVSGLGMFFLLGIFSTRITGWGVLSGFILSSVALYLVKQYTPLHWSAYSIVVLVSCGVTAFIASMLFGDKKEIDGLTWKTLNDKK
jgi:cyclically-permuted mutarotase family protein